MQEIRCFGDYGEILVEGSLFRKAFGTKQQKDDVVNKRLLMSMVDEKTYRIVAKFNMDLCNDRIVTTEGVYFKPIKDGSDEIILVIPKKIFEGYSKKVVVYYKLGYIYIHFCGIDAHDEIKKEISNGEIISKKDKIEKPVNRRKNEEDCFSEI